MFGPVGRPQWIAGALLLVFLAQCAWLVSRSLRAGQMDLREWYRLDTGLRRWHNSPRTSAASDPHSVVGPGPPPRIRDNDGFDPDHSALWYLISSAPLLIWPGRFQSETLLYWGWLARIPYLAFGALLGASLWYVSRRLYGNEGGFIALTLYCFSPGVIRATALWFAEPEMGAAWGAFGTIFTGIAVAHTLYAPREVILWNWRRTLLLGVSLALAIGSQFSMMVVVPMALIFLLYVAPVRRRAGLVIWIAACVVGLIVLFGIYFFHLRTFLESMRHAVFLGLTWIAFAVLAVYHLLATRLGAACPAFLIILPVALTTYFLWPRSRYFGNTAPLLVGVLFVVLAMATPHTGGAGFLLAAIPFLFIFVSGVLADLLETRYRPVILACIVALLITYMARTLLALAQVSQN